MRSVTELLKQEGFLKSLFESIPCGILIVDQDRRVIAVNDILTRITGTPEVEMINKRGGDALNCLYAHKSPDGCGYADECRNCKVKKTALEALAGKQIHRNKASVQLKINGIVCDFKFLVSAAPINHDDNRLAVIILEDMTELNNLRRRLRTEHSFAGIIGQDTRMHELFDTIRDLTNVNVPVLILGESGTGKELVASAIHNEGFRAKKSFVPVNCAALPEGILESELFGHVKGAFTGAVREKRGRFELAHGGTLLLDEIGDMSKLVQAKLLRVLQEGKIERVGDEKSISVDVRIISATNRDLQRDVEKGRFRDDLYYRLNVVPIRLPPLRERKNDIPLLAENFLEKAYKEGLETAGLSKDALSVMIDYTWPGNVRELQSAISFAIVKSRGKIIEPQHLPMELKNRQRRSSSRGPSRKLDQDRVKDALARTGGNKAKAARLLGVGRATLYRFLSESPDVS
ncbi:MAG: sigma 54-interacting transcriptional regulator [Deltaproteobacteria bacterium]|nr:sigma 54-interacting transcriptional regulator [Deltaproteobacteria bacterium]